MRGNETLAVRSLYAGLGAMLGDLLSDAESACASVGYPCDCDYYLQSGPFTTGTPIANMPICYTGGVQWGFGADGIVRSPAQYRSDVEASLAPPSYTPPPSCATDPRLCAPTPAPQPTYSAPAPTHSPAPVYTAPTYTPPPAPAGYQQPQVVYQTAQQAAAAHNQVPAAVTLPTSAQTILQAAAASSAQPIGGGYTSVKSSTSTSTSSPAQAAAAAQDLVGKVTTAIKDNKELAIAAALAAWLIFRDRDQRGRR